MATAKANTTGTILSWLFGLLLIGIGIANILLIHPVPGILYILMSLIFFPPTSNLIENKFGINISPIIKIILAVAIMWFTLGMSDLFELVESYTLR